MARRTQILSIIRAVRGISSPTWMPGTLVAIGLNSPRTSAGASGLGSQVSCCGGPPRWKRTMQALALPRVAPAARARRSRAGSDRPKALRPPTRSHSRRVRPSHRRGPLLRMLHTAGSPWTATPAVVPGSIPRERGVPTVFPRLGVRGNSGRGHAWAAIRSLRQAPQREMARAWRTLKSLPCNTFFGLAPSRQGHRNFFSARRRVRRKGDGRAPHSEGNVVGGSELFHAVSHRDYLYEATLGRAASAAGSAGK